jgi:ribosome maturation factor RimP
MITTERLTEALERRLAGTPHFLVFAEVRPTGKAIVEVDNDKAVTLADLTAINQGLREEFGEALDDLELEVGSPGMGRPFRVHRQYIKHTGRLVEVKLADGRTLQGQLAAVTDQAIHLRVQHPSKVKGRLPKLDEEATAIPFAEIKSTQATIKF